MRRFRPWRPRSPSNASWPPGAATRRSRVGACGEAYHDASGSCSIRQRPRPLVRAVNQTEQLEPRPQQPETPPCLPGRNLLEPGANRVSCPAFLTAWASQAGPDDTVARHKTKPTPKRQHHRIRFLRRPSPPCFSTEPGGANQLRRCVKDRPQKAVQLRSGRPPYHAGLMARVQGENKIDGASPCGSGWAVPRAAPRRRHANPISATAAVAKGRLYMSAGNGSLYCLETGDEKTARLAAIKDRARTALGRRTTPTRDRP